jgi:hypothetical protein
MPPSPRPGGHPSPAGEGKRVSKIADRHLIWYEIESNSIEREIEALTGVKVSHSAQQQLVLSQDWPLPEAVQGVGEVSVDGGKVRLRGQPQAGSYWRDYKAVRLQGIYYGAFFADNQSAVDYVNSQPLVNPLVCLGDGHDGVWNLVKQFGRPDNFQRWEILDWYHLKENLYKVGGSFKRFFWIVS